MANDISVLCTTKNGSADRRESQRGQVYCLRMITLFTETGAVSKRRYPDSHSASHRKLTDVDKLLIIDIALSKPGVRYNIAYSKSMELR